MIDRQTILAEMTATGLIAVIRADSASILMDLCESLAEGGVNVCEITMTTPGALGAIEKTVQTLSGKCIIGVGSVLDSETARAAILAGAAFVVSPILNLQVVQMAHRYNRAVIPGALTPTEILRATEAGADVVKVFPANHFGPRYLKDLLAPMPHLKLTPTGGVTLETAEQWLEAGATCLGVGSALVRKDLVDARDWASLTQLARHFRKIVDCFRTRNAET